MADVLQTNSQIVLSVRMKGDAGPQTGDVVLGGASFDDFLETLGYDKNEVVVKDGALYRAKMTLDPQPWDPKNWEVLTDITIRLRDFEPNTEYKASELVKYNESLYRARYDFVSEDEFNLADWEGIDTVDVDIQNFQARNPYDKYETIVHDGKLWRAKEAFTSIATFNPNDWELLTDLKVLEFEPNTDYHKNNIITVAGVLYRALDDFTSSTTFNPNDWERLNVTGVNDFIPNNYYIKGSMISHNGKLYLAKTAFTTGALFDVDDWEIQNDIQVGDFLFNEFYPQNHIVFYNGQLWRSKVDFTSGGSWDESDWELLDPTKISDFKPNKFYFKDEVVRYNGNLYIAKADFTSGNTFNLNNWNEIAVHTLQMVYENSSNNFADPTSVRPQTGTVFEEKIFTPSTDSHIYTFADSSAGDLVKVQATNADGGYSKIESNKTSSIIEDEVFESKIQDSVLKIGVRRTGGYPYSFLSMNDNDQEAFLMEVNDVNSTVSFTPNIQKAFTDALCVASTTQRGTLKVDGETTRMNNDVLSAYAIAQMYEDGHNYSQYELTNYRDRLYFAKGSFTAGDWDVSQWHPVQRTVSEYTSGATYSVGDLVYVTYNTHRDLYLCTSDVNSAPATMNMTNWYKLEINGSNVYLNTDGFTTLGSLNAQDAYQEIDMQLFTNVRPLDDTTRYRITVQRAGTTPPAAISGRKIICLYTED